MSLRVVSNMKNLNHLLKEIKKNCFKVAITEATKGKIVDYNLQQCCPMVNRCKYLTRKRWFHVLEFYYDFQQALAMYDQGNVYFKWRMCNIRLTECFQLAISTQTGLGSSQNWFVILKYSSSYTPWTSSTCDYPIHSRTPGPGRRDPPPHPGIHTRGSTRQRPYFQGDAATQCSSTARWQVKARFSRDIFSPRSRSRSSSSNRSMIGALS